MADIILTEKQWEFLGQLALLAIGAIVTAFLVPHFTNKYDEKQRKRELEREDRRHQLQIQHEIIERITKVCTKAHYVGTGHGQKFGGQEKKFDFDYFLDIAVELFSIESLLTIYYKDNEKIITEWIRIRQRTNTLFDCVYPLDGTDVEEEIKDLLKTSNSSLSFEEAKKIIKEQDFYEFTSKLDFGCDTIIELIKTTLPKIN